MELDTLEGAFAGIAAPFLMVLLLRRLFSAAPHTRYTFLFLAGAAIAFVALLAEEFVWSYVGDSLPPDHALLIRAFLMIALLEELPKLGLMYGELIEVRPPTFRDFAVLAAWIGAGFAGAENALYILQNGSSVVIPRTLTATPFHICNAVVASRLLWLAHRDHNPAYLVAALASAVFLHGLYDYSIFTDTVGGGTFWFTLTMTGSIAVGLLCRREV